MTRNERCVISTNIHKINVIHFALNGVKEVMEQLGVEQYVIGGSVAALLYGVYIERAPHDIDIIVPKGMSKYIECMVNHSMIYVKCNSTSSIDDEFNTKHFAFKSVKFPVAIDIIEDITGLEKFNGTTPKVADLETLIAAKKHYHRAKDDQDLVQLKELLSKRTTKTSKLKTDIDALAELKEKMEQSE